MANFKRQTPMHNTTSKQDTYCAMLLFSVAQRGVIKAEQARPVPPVGWSCNTSVPCALREMRHYLFDRVNRQARLMFTLARI